MTCAVGSARPTDDGRVPQESRGEQEPERKGSEMVGHCLSDRWRDIAPGRENAMGFEDDRDDCRMPPEGWLRDPLGRGR